jgi:hypothetical protein
MMPAQTPMAAANAAISRQNPIRPTQTPHHKAARRMEHSKNKLPGLVNRSRLPILHGRRYQIGIEN